MAHSKREVIEENECEGHKMKNSLNAFLRLNWRISSFIVITFSIIFANSAQAAPAVGSVSGTVAGGQTITITGTGFGTTGPTIKVFDDFEKGANWNTIYTGAGSAQVGQWDAIGGYPAGIKYSSAYKRSGNLSYVQNWSSDNGAEGDRWVGIHSLGGATQIYMSWWAFIPTGVNVPGTQRGNLDPGGGPNWKIFWLYHNPYPASDFTSTFLSNTLPTRGAWFVGAGNDMSPARIDSGWNYDTSFIKGQWSRWEVYITGSTTSGILQFFETNASRTRNRLVNLSGVTMHTGETWDIVHFPGYGRGDQNSQTYYDDIYVATGPGALSRVEIGNNSAYSSCTNLAVITPTSWSSNSITATVRQGAFTAGSSAYLFVVDSTGAVSPGYPVTIGSGSNPAPAPSQVSAPTGLRVISN